MNGALVPLTERRLPVGRAVLVPLATTIAGSDAALLPIIVDLPLLPPLGLMMLLAWRLLRPEMWPAWIALPLGLADDLITGAPPGSAMALWTACLLAIDYADHRLPWRDHWTDWLLATPAISFCIAGGWLSARIAGGGGPLWMMTWPALGAILAFPAIVRLTATLDRWRLRQ